jgi:hypothetical protein
VNKNLSIWDSVQKTDPKYTKSFTRGGGFSGTAINAVYLIHKATELWGPIGSKWGYRNVNEEVMQGAPIYVNGEAVCHELIHKVTIEIFYPDGAITSFGVTTFVGKNKYGPFTDEEAPKKSLTDALTKGLSWLGFSSDVHLGLYDDNKYVAEVKKQFDEERKQSAKEPEQESAAFKQFEKEWLEDMRGAAKSGNETLGIAFKAMPASKLKTQFWEKHGAALKAAAQEAEHATENA